MWPCTPEGNIPLLAIPGPGHPWAGPHPAEMTHPSQLEGGFTRILPLPVPGNLLVKRGGLSPPCPCILLPPVTLVSFPGGSA